MSAAQPKEPFEIGRLLTGWQEAGWLRAVDQTFAEFLKRECPTAPPLLVLAAALTSHQLGRGHICLNLKAVHEAPESVLAIPPQDGPDWTGFDSSLLPKTILETFSYEDWLAALAHDDLIGVEGTGSGPLVLSGSRLYLRRYWRYEQNLKAFLGQPLILPEEDGGRGTPVELKAWLSRLFPETSQSKKQPDFQKIACALATRNRLTIITGGPGTGKTTTVIRVLAILQALRLTAPGDPAPPPLRIRLAAPTGKAAARLNESISRAVNQLPLGEEHAAIRAAIPHKVSTLHRLLGSRPDTRRFRHDRNNPLAVDVLIIDEASMVDMETLSAVLDALPREARLILLGDKDQLASVEAGAFLGDLCQRAGDGHYTPATRDWLEEASAGRIPDGLLDEVGTELDQVIVMLRHSHRFDETSGIGKLAARVNSGDPSGLSDIFKEDAEALTLVQPSEDSGQRFKAIVVDGEPRKKTGNGQADLFEADTTQAGYRHYLEVLQETRPKTDCSQEQLDSWARTVLKAHSQFQLLCILRNGPFGVEGLNLQVAQLLYDSGLIESVQGWYAGRPVLITRNDYSLGLMNGDVGITLPLAGRDGEADSLRVAFATGEDFSIKWVSPSRLQAIETVYALTVHKSQGSEFEHVALILPEKINPLMTRELVYTGITRAKRWFTLINNGPMDLFEEAIRRRVQRHSGLEVGGWGSEGEQSMIVDKSFNTP